jgi:hypothetical protein
MIVYFPYVCAEFCGISGIVTLLFTAMSTNRYVTPNLSERTITDAEVRVWTTERKVSDRILLQHNNLQSSARRVAPRSSLLNCSPSSA